MSEKFGQFLNKRRMELSQEEGLKYSLLTWRELALRAKLPETNLARWKEGMGTPNMSQVPKLAKVFGDGIYTALDLSVPVPPDTSPALRWLLRHRNDPAVKAQVEELQKRLEQETQHNSELLTA